MADHKVEGEEKVLGVGGGGDTAARVDDIVLNIDGEDLIFSEDTFPCLPDFPCLSSPSASTLHAKNAVLSSCSSTSSSSSSSSSSWSFLQVPDGGRVADSSEFADGLDILGDIDLFDLSIDPWDPPSLFHADEASPAVISGADESVGNREKKPCQAVEEGRLHGHGEGVPQQAQEEESSEELARIFLEWLRSNKDSISPEDLRSIKLKRATIECAARRLGRTKQGRTQLLKLILTWVQNNHLQRKRHRLPYSYDHQPRPFPISPNPNQLDFNCNPWSPYSMDPSTPATHPALLSAYAGGGNGEMGYSSATANPYPYHHSCGTSSVVVNNQPFSPSPDFVDPAVGPWPTQLASALPSMAPPQYSGGMANQFLGHPMYHQGQRLPGTTSATKEARKKRMARQRRFSSLHQHRNHNQPPHLQHAHHPVGSTDGANGNWGFWTSMSSSSHQMNHMAEAQMPPPAAQLPQRPQLTTASTSEKRQGWKGEKNLKFLLQKVLKQSDVGSLGRIVLPKKEAETHLPELDARDGISIPMEDIGTSQVWNMRYRFWPNNKSRMYLLENTGDFVRSNGLQEGDFIVIYSDVKCGKYMIRGVKVRQPMEPRVPSSRNTGKAHQRRNGLEKVAGSSKMKGRSLIHDDADNYGDDDVPPSVHA
ncbi:Regulatory protein viviparous-1 [Musa troglodytarum]|uniref:Regulatory protein viviparous-1 n=1 Tax=Musa troglodytarum TaxID=320322 RepID=A0A9E7GCM0_9LILI|nr:Regulatory protein viviparous-1 [Musa troglodytarum]